MKGAGIRDTIPRGMGVNFLFQQLFEAESSTYTYLLSDPKTKETVLIDPVLETAERDYKLLKELGMDLIWILETHVHADHVTGAGELRQRTGAKIALSRASNVKAADRFLEDGETIRVGSVELRAIATPGHTDSCMSYYSGDRVFTGDALLVRGTGRTDFQQGSSERLYENITRKLFSLPPETLVYPAHDYKGFTSSSIEAEKMWNPRVGGGKTKTEFIEIMRQLKLADPKKLAIAVPANNLCGALSKVGE